MTEASPYVVKRHLEKEVEILSEFDSTTSDGIKIPVVTASASNRIKKWVNYPFKQTRVH